MNKPLFTGACTALVTPFLNGNVNYPMLVRLLQRQIDAGITAVVLSGTTGESATLTDDEKIELFRRCKEYAGSSCKIIAGTGSNSTEHAVQLSKDAEQAGVDALLVVSPYYNKATPEGLHAHYLSISHAVNIPIILYNVPSRTGLDTPVSVYERLSRIPNIIGVKEASGNITQMDDIIKNKQENFMVISGDDGITFPLITLGAVGVISVIGNAFPKEFSKMVRLALNGDFEKALLIHHRFTELFSLLFVDGNPAGVKCLLNAMGYIENELRLPLVPTRITTYEKIRQVLDSLN